MMENKTKIDLKNKSIFITGVAGFIGSNLAKRLLSTVEGVKVVGLDNMNNYYDVRLKEARLKELEQFEKFSFVKGNLADKAVIESIFEQYKPEIVVNLGAQAGVRYSITNPDAYVEANLIGFYNILEVCRHSYDEGHTPVEHLVYASSSSVYGSNKKVPYSTDDKVDNPVSLYTSALERDFGYADAAGNTVIYMVPNYQIDGKTGTWLPYDSEVVEGVCFFMMRNEQRKDAVSPVVVDSKGVFVTDAPNGFENVRSTLTEYVQRAEKKQQDMTEHEKCLTNGTYERARESGIEQNYDMIDGCVNNVPKKPRRIGGRWSVLDRLHIKQAQRKQKDQTQQQQQERSRKN